MLRVVSPVAGHSLAVSDIPDPVFARGLVGPGTAIRPRGGRQVAVAPVSGVLAKLHPHAYLVVSDAGNGVLVHLGIDTVHMQGECFELLAREGEHVEARDEIVAWDPSQVEQVGSLAGLCGRRTRLRPHHRQAARRSTSTSSAGTCSSRWTAS